MTDAANNKQIIFLHGAGPKPYHDELLALWLAALKAGMQRDFPDTVTTLEQTPTQMIYFAPSEPDNYDRSLDLDNRRQALTALASHKDSKDFRRRYYDALPGKSTTKEFILDAGASIGIGGFLMRRKLPALFDYLDGKEHAIEPRLELKAALTEAIDHNRKVLLITHCMGSVIAYDAMWSLNREDLRDERNFVFVSMGSPLADNTVRGRLIGAKRKDTDRYPNNISNWYNLSAEDDFVCHDKTVWDDFKVMREKRMINNIEDFTIYNLAVRYGISNPHSSVGYLIHPRLSRIVSAWLTS